MQIQIKNFAGELLSCCQVDFVPYIVEKDISGFSLHTFLSTRLIVCQQSNHYLS